MHRSSPSTSAIRPATGYNNGAPTWDGNDSTMPANNSWADFVFPLVGTTQYRDLAVPIYDTNGDGDTLDAGEGGAGNRGYLMIGDWDNDGMVSAGENVLVVSRTDALSLLNSSQKQVQDGRFELSRDVVASWLNVMAGSYEGVVSDPKSVTHYIDEAVAFLIKTTNGDHRLTVAELTSATAVSKSGVAWQSGYDFDGDSVKGENDTSGAPSHVLGASVSIDIMSGSAIHTGLDYYNNNGYIA